MTKKIWRDQADDYLRQILGLLQAFEDVDCIAQESYKSMFFKVFVDAFVRRYCTPSYRESPERNRLIPCKEQRPLISGDVIWAFAKTQGWVHAEMRGDEKRYCDIQTVMTWWDEWVYAWKHPIPTIQSLNRKKRRQDSDSGSV